jgi:hypothetical protein
MWERRIRREGEGYEEREKVVWEASTGDGETAGGVWKLGYDVRERCMCTAASHHFSQERWIIIDITDIINRVQGTASYTVTALSAGAE